MNKLILCAAILFSSICIANAQTVPAKINSFLNRFYAGWKPAPGFCDEKKSWFLRGDFDGDGLQDYIVRVKTGKTAKSMKLHLVGFINAGDGNYPVANIGDESYTGDLLRSTFAIIKKGKKVSLGEGDGKTITLKTDAVTQYICETDASKVFVYKEGQFQNIFDN